MYLSPAWHGPSYGNVFMKLSVLEKMKIPIAWDAEPPEWSPEIEAEDGLRFGELRGWIALDETATRKTPFNEGATHECAS